MSEYFSRTKCQACLMLARETELVSELAGLSGCEVYIALSGVRRTG